MITVHIPKGGTPLDLRSELSSARNIKDKATRKATETGLRRMISYL